MFYKEEAVYQRVLLITDIHYGSERYGYENSDRMNIMCNDLTEEYREHPYDMILCLGDYSLDFWGWPPYGTYMRTPSVCDTGNFVNEICSRFPAPTYMIPGNHEQYGHRTFMEITGNPRQFAVQYGKYVFVMCDTFAGDLDPVTNHDGFYSGLDVQFLAQTLERYKEHKVFICAHDVQLENEGEEFKRVLRENPRILGIFAGHNHEQKTVYTDESCGKIPIFYCGAYSYNNVQGHNGPRNWGYCLLDLSNTVAATYIRSRSIE